MTSRSEITAAIGSVDGVTAHEYVTGDTDKGTAYPRISVTEYPNKFGGITTWDVIVLLPQDLGDAERYLDENAAAWVTALSDVLRVKTIRPQRLQLDGVGVLPAAFITGTRPTDPSTTTEV